MGNAEEAHPKDDNMDFRCTTFFDTYLNFCLFNFRSLISKPDDFGEFLGAYHFDVIAITEILLSSENFENKIRLPGYTCFCAYSSQRRRVKLAIHHLNLEFVEMLCVQDDLREAI